MHLSKLIELIPLFFWMTCWGLGGIWIARAAFTLRRNEQALAGFGLGLVMQIWLANLVAQVLPVPLAFWVAAVLVLIFGLLCTWPRSPADWLELVKIPVYPVQWLVFCLLAYVFIYVGRGLAMLDDFQNLPITSLIATGDIPPHFALDPSVNFGYHYFTMLFAGQLMRIGDFFVWSALDIARGFSFALAVILCALFVQRVASSRLAGYVAGLFAVFAGGTRWLLLLLPPGLVAKLATQVILIGSGAASGADLATALVSPWGVSGAGPYPFPFAFVNGLYATGVMSYHSGSGGLVTLIAMLLLLFHNKWRSRVAWVSIAILLAALGLANEVVLVQVCLGISLLIILYMVVRRTRRLPRSLWRWFAVCLAGGLVALLQGGVLTALFLDALARFLPGYSDAARAYHTFRFSLFWPPKILSSHLGYLAVNNPIQLFVALIEIGPLVLALPWVGAWMVKAFRFQRWYEVALAISALASLGLFTVQLSGAAGLTALIRAQNLPLSLAATFSVPALWLWARQRSEKIKAGVAGFLLLIMLGGVVLFGIELIAIPKPVYSDFIGSLDARMTGEYWNRLEPDALIFDPNPYRAPVVFGRMSDAAFDWFERKPEWLELYDVPNPTSMHAAGYNYLYIGREYWSGLSPEGQAALQAPCVRMIREIQQKFPEDFRWLLDIRGCN